MIRDPHTVWNGRYPYEALEPAGIGPASTQDEVEDASFTLMTKRLMNPVTQTAWDELRELPKRLLADALLYDVDTEAEIERAGAWVRRERESQAQVDTDRYWSMPPELPAALAADLPELEVGPPPEVELPAEADQFPSQAFIDKLIRFDR
ncbi:hypothetical protein [Glycomyces buryatensis]|uniref:Uncharacterized protein n=1 Tax=Glycomyces buryatensis TaxID=2570927 RepID=A0A4V4HRZ9_9ACTN|nr:hypothetical protein [Glycomyces buryatensis]THV39836.1 hypothetical protein FAB82_16640 [Glycomyces buryatensis]